MFNYKSINELGSMTTLRLSADYLDTIIHLKVEPDDKKELNIKI